MRLLSAICMPALMLGAAAFVTPALAQADAGAKAAAAAPAQPAQDANSATVPAQSAQGGATASDQPAMNKQSSSRANAAASPSGNSQMGMNTTGNANDLSSIPDNQHKYNRAQRAKDNQSEGQTTKQLNQQEASLNGSSNAGAGAQ